MPLPRVLPLALPFVLLSASAQSGPVTVTTMPFEPRASLGGEFYRVTGATCEGVVSVTAGAASQLPADRTLAACLIYRRYSTAPNVASVIAAGMNRSGYLRANEQVQATWAMLSYAGYTDRICQNLVYGIREMDRQVNVGVYCLPYTWTKTKAENYAVSQISGQPLAALPPTKPAPKPLTVNPPSSKALLGTGTPLNQTVFCKARIQGCGKLKFVDASSEFRMQVMEGPTPTGHAEVTYTYNPTRAVTAGYKVTLPLNDAKIKDAAAFLAEWGGLPVPTAGFKACASLKSYDSLVLATKGKVAVSCQNRVDEVEFMVAD